MQVYRIHTIYTFMENNNVSDYKTSFHSLQVRQVYLHYPSDFLPRLTAHARTNIILLRIGSSAPPCPV